MFWTGLLDLFNKFDDYDTSSNDIQYINPTSFSWSGCQAMPDLNYQQKGHFEKKQKRTGLLYPRNIQKIDIL